jgi:hypothetical protein
VGEQKFSESSSEKRRNPDRAMY